MGKRIIDFDPEAFAFGDYLLFWDSSANGGLGGTRKGDVAGLAELMAGQGLQADSGKLGLGGTFEENIYLLGFGGAADIQFRSEFGGNSRITIDSYTADYISVASLYLAEGLAVLNSDGGTGQQAHIQIDGPSGNITLFAYNGIDSPSSRIRATAPLTYNMAFNSEFDNDDNTIPSSFWVRSKLQNTIKKGSNTFFENENLHLDFQGWSDVFEASGFSVSTTVDGNLSVRDDGFESTANIYAVQTNINASNYLSLYSPTLLELSTNAHGVAFTNESPQNELPTTAGSAPSTRIGQDGAWLGLPSSWLRIILNDQEGYIPFYKIF
jgi:hypothetical protein